MRAGLHYVTFNIAASTLFLVALGLLYGLLGSLNMAELSVRVAQLPPGDVALVQAAAGLLFGLAVAPFGFWFALAVTIAVTVAGIWICGESARGPKPKRWAIRLSRWRRASSCL